MEGIKQVTKNRLTMTGLEYMRTICPTTSVGKEPNREDVQDAFEDGIAEGYKQAEKDLGWHSVKESLPPYDEEVIVLTDYIAGKHVQGANKLCFGHRPDPKGWDGKDLVTGKVEHFQPKTYDGWNTPGVHHWMYCPKLNGEEIKSFELTLKYNDNIR